MSLYNALFGMNPVAPLLLAALKLQRWEVGRFRDAFVANGEIAIYTRNGGGNRCCVCRDTDDEHPYATKHCKHRSFEREEDEYTTSGLIVPTGRRVTVTRYVCLAPDSAECGCYGCAIEHRLPRHPLYLRDRDDSFDSTYATIYFSLPPEHADVLRTFDTQRPFDPDNRWLKVLDQMKEPGYVPPPEVQALMDQLAAWVKENA